MRRRPRRPQGASVRGGGPEDHMASTRRFSVADGAAEHLHCFEIRFLVRAEARWQDASVLYLYGRRSRRARPASPHNQLSAADKPPLTLRGWWRFDSQNASVADTVATNGKDNGLIPPQPPIHSCNFGRSFNTTWSTGQKTRR